jgi:hypothetical protein
MRIGVAGVNAYFQSQKPVVSIISPVIEHEMSLNIRLTPRLDSNTTNVRQAALMRLLGGH